MPAQQVGTPPPDRSAAIARDAHHRVGRRCHGLHQGFPSHQRQIGDLNCGGQVLQSNALLAIVAPVHNNHNGARLFQQRRQASQCAELNRERSRRGLHQAFLEGALQAGRHQAIDVVNFSSTV
jgi:hypothetical protein